MGRTPPRLFRGKASSLKWSCNSVRTQKRKNSCEISCRCRSEPNGSSVHPNLAFTHDVLGKLPEKRGDLATAEVEFTRGFEINKELFGEKEYRTAISANNLAEVLLKEHHYARAETLLRSTVQALTESPYQGT